MANETFYIIEKLQKLENKYIKLTISGHPRIQPIIDRIKRHWISKIYQIPLSLSNKTIISQLNQIINQFNKDAPQIGTRLGKVEQTSQKLGETEWKKTLSALTQWVLDPESALLLETPTTSKYFQKEFQKELKRQIEIQKIQPLSTTYIPKKEQKDAHRKSIEHFQSSCIPFIQSTSLPEPKQFYLLNQLFHQCQNWLSEKKQPNFNLFLFLIQETLEQSIQTPKWFCIQTRTIQKNSLLLSPITHSFRTHISDKITQSSNPSEHIWLQSILKIIDNQHEQQQKELVLLLKEIQSTEISYIWQNSKTATWHIDKASTQLPALQKLLKKLQKSTINHSPTKTEIINATLIAKTKVLFPNWLYEFSPKIRLQTIAKAPIIIDHPEFRSILTNLKPHNQTWLIKHYQTRIYQVSQMHHNITTMRLSLLLKLLEPLNITLDSLQSNYIKNTPIHFFGPSIKKATHLDHFIQWLSNLTVIHHLNPEDHGPLALSLIPHFQFISKELDYYFQTANTPITPHTLLTIHQFADKLNQNNTLTPEHEAEEAINQLHHYFPSHYKDLDPLKHILHRIKQLKKPRELMENIRYERRCRQLQHHCTLLLSEIIPQSKEWKNPMSRVHLLRFTECVITLIAHHLQTTPQIEHKKMLIQTLKPITPPPNTPNDLLCPQHIWSHSMTPLLNWFTTHLS